MGLKWLLLPTRPTSPRIWNTQLVPYGYQIQIEVMAIFLKEIRAHMETLISIKVKILVLIIRSSYRSPIIDNWSLEWLSYFELAVASLFDTCLFDIRFWEPHQTAYHSNLSVLIRRRKRRRIVYLCAHGVVHCCDMKLRWHVTEC